MDFEKLIDGVLPEIVELRHDIHRHPELGFQEHHTRRLVLDKLSTLGNLTIGEPLATTGIVATLNADRPGPCVAFRADMDALPIVEQTGVPYASQTDGVMHACGHDGHTAILTGTAMVLSRLADRFDGKVKFIFQPAEEGGGGGGVMVEHGALEAPPVEMIFALHGWWNLPIGSIGVRPGPSMASTNALSVRVIGQQSHGAYPHKSVDPITGAAYLITALQTVVSRRLDPVDSAVVSVGQISAGTAVNIIPADARFAGTIRALRPDTRRAVVEDVRRIIEHTAAAHGLTVEVDLRDGYPPVVNDPKACELAAAVGRDVLGSDRVDETLLPTMGGEDFAYFLQRVPGMMFRLGLVPPGGTSPRFHTPVFDFHDDALPVGIRMFCGIVERFFSDRRAGA